MGHEPDRSSADTFVDVSREYGDFRCFRTLPPLVLRANPHIYPDSCPDSDLLGTTWLRLALRGMEALRARMRPRVRRAAILGTGSGLDAIGISHLFAPEELTASDIHPRVIEAAKWNIAAYAHPETRCQVLQSDLFRQYPDADRFDLIFENLPNLPGDSDLLEGIRSASQYHAPSYRSEPISDRALLTLHYNCLLQARSRLRSDGWIVCMIGGRVPWETIEGMFTRAGFSAAILAFGLKTQTEAGVVLSGYARAERNGSPSFIFYHPIERCREILLRHSPDPSDSAEANDRDIDPSTRDVALLNAALESCRISAATALSRHEKGEAVCHSVYAVGGTPAAPGAPE